MLIFIFQDWCECLEHVIHFCKRSGCCYQNKTCHMPSREERTEYKYVSERQSYDDARETCLSHGKICDIILNHLPDDEDVIETIWETCRNRDITCSFQIWGYTVSHRQKTTQRYGKNPAGKYGWGARWHSTLTIRVRHFFLSFDFNFEDTHGW